MLQEILIGLLTVFLWFAYWCFQQRRKFRAIECFPGPKPWPVIGNALEFGMNPVDRLKNLSRLLNTYGPNTRIYIGPNRALLLTSDPELTEFFLSSPKYIEKSTEYDLFRPWLCNGLLISTGSYWQKRRKAITPTFHFKILDEFLPTISSNANILTSKLEDKTRETSTFDIYPYVTNFTLDTICETSMGTPVNAQAKPDNEYVNSVKSLCNIINARSFSSWQMFDSLFRLSCSYRTQMKCLKVLHNFTMGVIEKRRAQVVSRPNNTELTDEFGKKRRVAFLDLLLQTQIDGKPLTNSDVREEVDTFMFEGHDTTASGIAFTLFELSRNPDIQEKLWNEIHELFGDEEVELSQADMGNMKYAEMVLKESLRLYPSVPFIARRLTEDVVYKGTVLPKDLHVTFVIFDMQRRADFFKDPDTFNPDRFLPDSGDTKHPFAFVPFSAGPRNCIGQKFAMQEMKMALYKIIRKYKILPAEGFQDLLLSAEIILKSENGVPVRLKKR